MDARRSAATAANMVACAVLAGLGAIAIGLTVLLGPFGLVLLGLLTLVVCTKFELDEHAPTWGARVFAVQMDVAGSAEERARRADLRRVALAPVRFYRWCGLVLLLAGCAGVGWQYLGW